MKQYRILLIEDSDLDAELLNRYLLKAELSQAPERVENSTDFIKKLEEPWDCIISDFNVPGFGAIAALEILKERKLDIPLLIVSGQIGEENAVAALRAGAEDFVMKSNLSRLGPAVHRCVRDSSHRRRENELREAHERAVKDRERLLAVVSHDLKNPLSSIQLAAQWLLSKSSQDEPVNPAAYQKNAARILRAAERIDRLIHDILDQAKIEAGRFVIEPVNTKVAEFWQELKDVFTPLATERGVLLRFSDVERQLKADFDRDRIFQVASNLISNAIKFSPEGSQVNCWVEPSEEGVKFFVRDQGPGIPEEDKAHVFSKFYQSPERSTAGTGLGLSIAQEIIKSHSGTIGFDSVDGEGTTFWFYLPKVVGACAPAEHPQKGSRILLVDDDDDLREAMRMILEEGQNEVVEARSVKEAISCVEKAPSEFPVLIVDYDLPGQTGADLIHWLRANMPSAGKSQIILMSAHPDVHDRGKSLGVANVVRKPMKLERLIEVVRKSQRTLNEDLGKGKPLPDRLS